MTPGWVPVALSRMIEPGTSAGAMVDGAEIVVWRDTAGRANVWEDRCPHRGMRLSFGFVRGDHIACLYHGWEFDAAGQCRRIPAHPALVVPSTICARVYPVTETGGMIWVAGDAAKPLQALPPATGVRSLYLDCTPDHALGLLGAALDGVVVLNGALASVVTPDGPVRVGVQQVAPRRCALHFAVPGPAAPERLVALASRAESLRRTAEARRHPVDPLQL